MSSIFTDRKLRKNGYLCTCLLGKCCLVTGHQRPLGDAANCNLRTKSLTFLIQEPLIYIIFPFSERLYTVALGTGEDYQGSVGP